MPVLASPPTIRADGECYADDSFTLRVGDASINRRRSSALM